MGGTDPTNFLNSMGKTKDGSGNGDILLWKRKGEKYLVDVSILPTPSSKTQGSILTLCSLPPNQSGLRYTIIHPSRLVDTPGSIDNIRFDTDDKLLENKKRSIAREDVANLCCAALTVAKDRSVSFDVIASPVDGKPPKSAEDALRELLRTKRTAD